ncbi:MAG: YciI family protein [Coxiellaceae bacterium]|nr:YciI family protein [Coxiellaceae bacterium]
MFIIELTYLKPLDVIDQLLVAHRSFLDECYKKNYFFASGPKNPRTGGIILSHLTDRKAIDEIIQQDPFYIEEIAEYKIIEFSPVKYDGHFLYYIADK